MDGWMDFLLAVLQRLILSWENPTDQPGFAISKCKEMNKVFLSIQRTERSNILEQKQRSYFVVWSNFFHTNDSK